MADPVSLEWKNLVENLQRLCVAIENLAERTNPSSDDSLDVGDLVTIIRPESVGGTYAWPLRAGDVGTIRETEDFEGDVRIESGDAVCYIAASNLTKIEEKS